MNFSEFRKLLGADPENREPETLRARNSGPEFEAAAREAEAFERKLRDAVRITVDDTILDELLQIPARPAGRRLPRWLAMAASVVIVAGVAGVLWFQSGQPDTVDEYVAAHFAHDGARLDRRARDDFDPAAVARILASFDMRAAPELASRVQFIKYCPTMDGRGAHMVVRTGQGPVHLIYMPNTPVEDGRDIRFGQMQAKLVDLQAGSVAVIGHPGPALPELGELVRTAITPIGAGA